MVYIYIVYLELSVWSIYIVYLELSVWAIYI